MNWTTAFQVIGTVLFSFGGAGVIIFSLSSWLGKVWASRILEKERSKLAKSVELSKQDMELLKTKLLNSHNDKIAIYRMAFDTIAEILSALDTNELRGLSIEESQKVVEDFNRKRMIVYAYLGMLAPQRVMDAQDELMDELIRVVQGTNSYVWENIRNLTIGLLNEMRADIGLDTSEITYNGGL